MIFFIFTISFLLKQMFTFLNNISKDKFDIILKKQLNYLH